MVRGASKVDEPSTRQNAEFQKLNDRIEQMAAQFGADLDSFKKDLKEKVSLKAGSNEQTGDVLTLTNRFSVFEKSAFESLQTIKQDLNQLKTEVSKQTMSANQNTILIHGLDESQGADLYENVVKLITTKIKVKVSKADLNYCYRLGVKKSAAKKPRPVVVSFCQRWLRDQIFYNKRELKGSTILFTEMLTAESLKLFKEAKDRFKNSCWTMGGRVFVINSGAKVFVNSLEKLNSIVSSISIISDGDSDS